MQIALIKSTPTDRDGEFRQEWEIDGHTVVTDAEWGNVDIVSGGSLTGTIDGRQMNLGHVVATVISTGTGPCSDGETGLLDAEWVASITEMGVDPDMLDQPV